ncbi:hypothetical protein OESDEN_18883 [Oesophagostomum dentatum]|uniref:Clathrin/coatomer adaptor adaptin-like N-terminal domain-containing protein n=1 Tax=Oesophagostomum dentatum TaxID=61180 RepID=A0A0B1SC13_OESDE|nr:hypothetical protein OESDEN_18883 [Oesophagostomum dentatum]
MTLNDYVEVRAAAQFELFLVFAEYTVARGAIIDNIIPALIAENTSKEKIRGALNVISKSQLAVSSSTPVRLRVWKALLEMKARIPIAKIRNYNNLLFFFSLAEN